jgi:diguanylate cyclase (GGDEF)-like protein
LRQRTDNIVSGNFGFFVIFGQNSLLPTEEPGIPVALPIRRRVGTWLDSSTLRMATANVPQPESTDMDRDRGKRGSPRTTAELRGWIRSNLSLDAEREARLLQLIDDVVARQRQLIEESKHDAIRALAEGFAGKMDRLQRQLTEKDVTVSNIARYFEEVIADLTEKSHRDPKTKLLNFDWFMERVESFLAVEQRVRWCCVGVVDITSFKGYNDTLGHAVGDRIIESVARILADQIRSEDFLAVERGSEARDLHARFGGDEFCFLIPDLPGCSEAVEIAERFKRSVEGHDWGREDRRLATRPVKVDVGVVCLRLGPVSERRGVARKLAADLIHRADTLMYDAKGAQSSHVYPAAVRVSQGELAELPNSESLFTEVNARRAAREG